jgi:hypothetical protein
MLCALLCDTFADRLSAQAEAEDDLVFRDRLARQSVALGLVFGVAAQRHDGPGLVLEAVAVPGGDVRRLGLEDFMVSLYNGHEVQRVLIVSPDGSRANAHEVLKEAIAVLRSLVER